MGNLDVERESRRLRQTNSIICRFSLFIKLSAVLPLSFLGVKMASIRKRGKKWQARVQRLGFPDVAKSFAQKTDADRWVRQTKAAMDKCGYAPTAETDRTTLGEVLQKYRSHASPA